MSGADGQPLRHLVDWDEELLALELLDIKDSDFDLALTGFDTREIDALLAILVASEAWIMVAGETSTTRCL